MPSKCSQFSVFFKRNWATLLAIHGLGLMLQAQISWGATGPLNTEDYTIDTWQVEEGLPQVSVTAITQTPDGYLWLGTFNGLARFDGVRFTVFDQGNIPELGNSRIIGLDIDPQGALLIVTETGGLIRMIEEHFTACRSHEDRLQPGVLHVVRDQANRLLSVDYQGGLRRIENDDLLPLDSQDRLQTRPEPELLLKADGLAWIGERGKATRSASHTFPVQESAKSNGALTELTIQCAAKNRAGGYWLAATTSVYRLDGGRLQWLAPPFLESPLPLNFMAEDAQGNLWIGSPEHGLFRWHPSGRSERFSLGRGLLDNHVSALFCDREGNLWVGTGQGGLHRFKRRLVRMYDTPGSGSANVITTVNEDRQGRMWVGVNGAGLHRWEAGQLKPVTEPPALRQYPLVYSVLADRQDAIWIGLYGRTALRLHNQAVTVYSLEKGWQPTTPWALFEDRAGAVWLGTGHGLQKYHQGRFTRYTRQEGLSHDDVRALAEGPDGTLYIGTSGGGLNCLRDGRFTCLTESEGLADNHISALYVDGEDTVWIGTVNGGLSRFQQGKISNLSRQGGLPSNTIDELLEDDQANLWMGSNRGLIRLNRRALNEYLNGQRHGLVWQVFGRSDGLHSIACGGGGQPACCRARDGRLWFATVNGVAVVNPKDLALNPFPPPVVIEEVELDERRVVTSQWSRPGAQMPEYRSQRPGTAPLASPILVVPPGVHRLEFHFTGLSLVAPEKVRFRYQLEQYDQLAIEAGARRTAPYTQVPPGHYRFRVAACNDAGVWNDAGAVLAVVVQPAWWQTWWFRALVFTGAAGSAVGSFEARLRRNRREHAAQQVFSRRLLESQEDERKRIAGELHDSLGQNLLVIKNRALLGLQNPTAEPPTVEQFNEISRMASQTLEEVRQISFNLRPYHLDRLGLTKALQTMITAVSSASGISFAVALDPLDGLMAPALEIHFYRVVQELLNNIVKHSQAATASVAIKHQGAKLLLTIEDDGQGFESATLMDPAPATAGLGLTDVTERVRILGGTARCNSRPTAGARWTIELPVK
jgi:signal transduction histidine kinase/ligand-binding sensor domain-containing protein